MRQSPQISKEAKEYFLAKGDLNKIYLNDIMGGSQQQRGFIEEVSSMLAFTNRVQKHLKKNGVTQRSPMQCETFRAEAKLTGLGLQVGEQVLDIVRKMAKDLTSEHRILATSDVIESLNGQWKMLIRASPNPGLGSNALLMPALMRESTAEEIKAALQEVSVSDVSKWRDENFGQTFHQAKLEVRPPKRRQISVRD